MGGLASRVERLERLLQTQTGPDVAAPLPLLEWALAHRIINGTPFTVIPPLRAVYQSTHPRIIVRKAAQVFVSEWLTNVALWVADTCQGERGNVLYVFPRKEQGADFSQARIDKAIEESPYLAARTILPANVGLKRVGGGYLYVRGSQNRNQILSVDADCVCCDEVAQYDAGVVEVVQRRLGSSLLGWVRAGSTPRYPGDEAGHLWDRSTQAVYEVRCSHCGTWQALAVETHLNPETARVECRHCHGDLGQDRLGAGHWTPQHPGREWEGFQVHPLLSPRADLAKLAASFLRVQEGRATATQVQEFWNQDAGVPHLPAGGHLAPDLLDACIDPAWTLPGTAQEGYMGVDVGSRLHVRINVREADGLARAVCVASVREFSELDGLMARYGVRQCVIDANPETREATAFAERHRGKVWLAYYPHWSDDQRSELCVWDRERRVVKINRTAALDMVNKAVGQRRLILPRNAHELGGAVDRTGVGEYYRHLGSPIRVVEDDARGNPVARYEQNGPDHYAHAEVYALVAASRRHEAGILFATPQPELPADAPIESRIGPGRGRNNPLAYPAGPFAVLRR